MSKPLRAGGLHMDGSTMRVPNVRVPDPPVIFDLRGTGIRSNRDVSYGQQTL